MIECYLVCDKCGRKSEKQTLTTYSGGPNLDGYRGVPSINNHNNIGGTEILLCNACASEADTIRAEALAQYNKTVADVQGEKLA
jgi:hypothetical protein